MCVWVYVCVSVCVCVYVCVGVWVYVWVCVWGCVCAGTRVGGTEFGVGGMGDCVEGGESDVGKGVFLMNERCPGACLTRPCS